MKFNNLKEIEKEGFNGFISLSELFKSDSIIPKGKGVYMILFDITKQQEFMEDGSGGFFKGKNPNVSISILEENWVEKTCVLYIGKAGSESGSASLHSRLRQYFRFGQGKNVGHWGGRFIWQLKDYGNLIVCWKPTPLNEPAMIESDLINSFKLQYGKRPYANLTK